MSFARYRNEDHRGSTITGFRYILSPDSTTERDSSVANATNTREQIIVGPSQLPRAAAWATQAMLLDYVVEQDLTINSVEFVLGKETSREWFVQSYAREVHNDTFRLLEMVKIFPNVNLVDAKQKIELRPPLRVSRSQYLGVYCLHGKLNLKSRSPFLPKEDDFL